MSNSDPDSKQVKRFFWLVSFFLGVSLGAKCSVSLILRLDRIRDIPLLSRAWDGIDKACDAISFLLFLTWTILIVLMLVYAVVSKREKTHHERYRYNHVSSETHGGYTSIAYDEEYDERYDEPYNEDYDEEVTFLRRPEHDATSRHEAPRYGSPDYERPRYETPGYEASTHEIIRPTVSRTSESRATNSTKDTAPLQDFSQELKLIFERRRRQNSLAELKALLYN